MINLTLADKTWDILRSTYASCRFSFFAMFFFSLNLGTSLSLHAISSDVYVYDRWDDSITDEKRGIFFFPFKFTDERVIAIYRYEWRNYFFSSVFLNITSTFYTSLAFTLFVLSSFFLKRFLQVRRPVDWRWGGGWNVFLCSREVYQPYFSPLCGVSIAYVYVCTCKHGWYMERTCSLSDFRKGHSLRGKSES